MTLSLTPITFDQACQAGESGASPSRRLPYCVGGIQRTLWEASS